MRTHISALKTITPDTLRPNNNMAQVKDFPKQATARIAKLEQKLQKELAKISPDQDYIVKCQRAIANLRESLSRCGR